MLSNKIKNLIKAFTNAYIYDEMINAKSKLCNINYLIEKRNRELSELDSIFNENKKKIVYSFFSNEEVIEIKKKQIEDNLYYLLDKFHKKLEEEISLKNKAFKIVINSPSSHDILTLHFLSKKFNNGHNFKSTLNYIKGDDGNNFSSWKEVSMTVKILNENLYIDNINNQLRITKDLTI
jgi:hypothetical protein